MTEVPNDPSNIVPGPGYSGSSSLPPGPPLDNGVELLRARVEVLDKKLDELNRKAEQVDDRLRGAEVLLARVDGNLNLLTSQVIGKLPSWWQLPVAIVGIVSFFSLLLGVAERLHFLDH